MTHVVKVGQIYEDTDPRSNSRRFQIVDIEGLKAVARTIRPDGVMEARTRIALHRLNPTLGKRGYKLIEEAP